MRAEWILVLLVTVVVFLAFPPSVQLWFPDVVWWIQFIISMAIFFVFLLIPVFIISIKLSRRRDAEERRNARIRNNIARMHNNL